MKLWELSARDAAFSGAESRADTLAQVKYFIETLVGT